MFGILYVVELSGLIGVGDCGKTKLRRIFRVTTTSWLFLKNGTSSDSITDIPRLWSLRQSVKTGSFNDGGTVGYLLPLNDILLRDQYSPTWLRALSKYKLDTSKSTCNIILLAW